MESCNVIDNLTSPAINQRACWLLWKAVIDNLTRQPSTSEPTGWMEG
jgi:hypothetical protein